VARTFVTTRLPPDCWQFLDEMRSWPTTAPLPADVQTILGAPPRIEVRMPIPEPRFVLTMTRHQMQAVQRWLQALHDDLKHDDARRLVCLHCISRFAGALRLAEE
jgi:hypothetical protein